MRAFRLWLGQFNLLAVWREERRLDREAKLQIVSDLCDVIRSQNQVSLEALGLASGFLKNFQVEGDPQSYVIRDADEVKAAQERFGFTPEQLDALGYDPFTIS